MGNELVNRRSEYSEDISARIDSQVRMIVAHCHKTAQKIIQENRILVDRLVDLLIEQETIEGDRFREIVAQCQKLADEKLAAPA